MSHQRSGGPSVTKYVKDPQQVQRARGSEGDMHVSIMGKQKIMARQGGENILIMDIGCTLVSFGMNMVTRWHEWLVRARKERESSNTLFRRLCLLDTNSAILVTEVGSNRLLTALTASSLDFITVGTVKETDLEDTRDGLDLVSQSSDLPLAVFARAILAVLHIFLDKKGLERSVDDVKTLVCLDGTSLCKSVLAKNRVNRADKLELAHDGSMGNGSNLDRY